MQVTLISDVSIWVYNLQELIPWLNRKIGSFCYHTRSRLQQSVLSLFPFVLNFIHKTI